MRQHDTTQVSYTTKAMKQISMVIRSLCIVLLKILPSNATDGSTEINYTIAVSCYAKEVDR